jgi:[acyl-carrier-protein] S-malonyltransferase
VGRNRLALGREEEVMRVGVIFPGQGSQGVGMGVEVAEAYPASMECFRNAKQVVGYDLFAICKNGPESTLLETRYAQPAIFVTNIALYAAVRDVLSPVVSAGHSFGELCSLMIADALSFEAALALVNERGLAMHRAAQITKGSMAAVLGLDPQALRMAVAKTVTQGAGRVQLANFNAPGQIVISGDAEAVRVAGELATEAGAKRVVMLNVAGAWHSTLMDSAGHEYASKVESAPISMPKFTVISNVDAKPYAGVPKIRENLVRSVTDEVLWHETALAMVGMNLDLIVEFGSAPVLSPMMKRIDGAPKAMTVSDVAGVKKLRAMLETANV